METIEIKNTSFLSKLNNYYYYDKPDSTCQLNKRLIIIFILTPLSFPVQIILGILKYRNPKMFSDENISYINFCFKIQILLTILGLFFLKKTNLTEISFSDVFFTWLINPILMIAIGMLIYLIIKLITKTFFSTKNKLPKVKKEDKKESIIKKLYLSFKEKYCLTINWVD